MEGIGYYQKYSCIVSFNGNKQTFPYSDSVANYQESKKPKKEDLIYCLCSDYNSESDSFDEFCNEFGYDQDSIKHKKIFDSIIEEKEKLNKLFTRDQMDILDTELREKGF